ncbi:hypothetical protein HZS_2845 [Henneguya salminicola]|nr:hypothetical protein HZS_2845 [Henneguya salminicola]
MYRRGESCIKLTSRRIFEKYDFKPATFNQNAHIRSKIDFNMFFHRKSTTFEKLTFLSRQKLLGNIL